MNLNLTNITSPLTIIALLAALVEASALASLPFLDDDGQDIYTWFLVGFPPFLTVLFFATLNFNSRVLFIPAPPGPPESPEHDAAHGELEPDLKNLGGSTEQWLVLIGDPQECELSARDIRALTSEIATRHRLKIHFISWHRQGLGEALLSMLTRSRGDISRNG